MSDSYSEALGVVLQGRTWIGDEGEERYVEVVLRIDDDDEERQDILDLRLKVNDELGEMILNVPRVDLLRALNLLGEERGPAA